MVSFQFCFKKRGRDSNRSAGAGAFTATLDWLGATRSSNKHSVVVPSSSKTVYDVEDEGKIGSGVGDSAVTTKEEKGR